MTEATTTHANDINRPTILTARERRSRMRAFVGRNAGLVLVYILVLNLPAVPAGIVSAISAASSPVGPVPHLDGTMVAIAQCVGMVAALAVLLVIRRAQVTDRAFWLGAPDRRRMTPGRFAAFVAIVAAIGGVTEVGTAALQSCFALFGISLTSASVNAINATMNESSLMIVAVVALAPVIEEVLFRGMVMGGLRARGKIFAIVTTAVLFGLMHGDLLQGLFAALGGVLLGYVAMEYSLVWAMALHFVNNGVLSVGLTQVIGLLPDAAQDPVYYGFLTVTSLIGLGVLWLRRTEIRDYITANRSPRGSYVGWTSARFLLMVLFCVIGSSAGFSLM